MTNDQLMQRLALLKAMAVSSNFRILHILSQSENALTTSELIKQAGVSKQSIWQSLRSLVGDGILANDTKPNAGMGNERQHYIAPDAPTFALLLFQLLFMEESELEQLLQQAFALSNEGREQRARGVRG